MKDDSKAGYGTISKVFHWGMAFLILWQLLKLSERLNEGEHWIGKTLVPWHVSIGTLILLLAVPRLIWAIRQRHKRPDQDPAMAAMVSAGHGLLYIVMLLMPITGVLYLIGEGYGWKAFGIQLVAQGDKVSWMHTVGELHSPLAWFFLVLIFGHIVIALWHHFIVKDDILRRML